jgi:hypothetical protein
MGVARAASFILAVTVVLFGISKAVFWKPRLWKTYNA